jgi:ABC-type multidrug transport system permease subunit
MPERPRPAFVELTLARLREMVREPEALFWAFAFPVVLAAMLALAFRSRPPDAIDVAVVAGAGSEARVQALRQAPELRPRTLPEDEARHALARAKVVLVVTADEPPVYVLDPTRPESAAARLAVDAALQRAAGRADAFAPRVSEVTEVGSRYVDFLLPGLLGMNLMGTGVWGISFSLVVARQGHLLKRFVAAPMRRGHFLGAQLAARMGFLVPEVVLLTAFGHYVLDVPVRGSLLLLGGVALLGALAFAGLGLLAAARARTVEGVSGVMNLIMLPMWIFSGTFFSTERFPAAIQPFVQALPLTALNDALRAVILDGAGLQPLLGELGILAVWCVVAFGLALRLFRWQ